MTSKRLYLTKAEILAKDDLVTEDLFVTEWDAWVRVRTLNASQRDWFESTTIQRNGKKITTNLANIRARLCLLCIVGEDGEPLFQQEDEFPLGGKSAAALDRIFTVAQRLNGLRDTDIEELAGESSAAQNGDSLSD